ncbi:hypothetical protein N0V90_007030 [Kalmusia sp. IMI 367209]|nr:hypothetical protein N0V90_007030 [Kalmusia sp. IMI 367209]
MQLFGTFLAGVLASVAIAAPAPTAAQDGVTTSFQPYNATADELAGLEKRAWQGCNSGGPGIPTHEIDELRDWLYQNWASVSIPPGQWLTRDHYNARLCILNDDKNAKNFDNWEEGWMVDYIAHTGTKCCSSSNCYGGWGKLKDTEGRQRKSFLQHSSIDCYVAH